MEKMSFDGLLAHVVDPQGHEWRELLAEHCAQLTALHGNLPKLTEPTLVVHPSENSRYVIVLDTANGDNLHAMRVEPGQRPESLAPHFVQSIMAGFN